MISRQIGFGGAANGTVPKARAGCAKNFSGHARKNKWKAPYTAMVGWQSAVKKIQSKAIDLFSSTATAPNSRKAVANVRGCRCWSTTNSAVPATGSVSKV